MATARWALHIGLNEIRAEKHLVSMPSGRIWQVFGNIHGKGRIGLYGTEARRPSTFSQ